MKKIRKKFNKLRNEDKAVCIFSIIMSIILILNIIANFLHLSMFYLAKKETLNQVILIDEKIDDIKNKIDNIE